MRTLIGDKKFYKKVLMVAIPIMVQNGITNFIGLLDNVMVGAVGTEQMSGVSISNQLLFIFNLCVFGAVSAAGIFTAQFYGQGNEEGVRYTVRYKLLVSILAFVAAVLVFVLAGKSLISLYLHDGAGTVDTMTTLYYGEEYLMLMLIGLLPFSIVQVYASTLRETGETILPMKAGIVAVLVNLLFNYLLIFGSFGFPRLGVAGAAIATIISRFVECAIVVIWTHCHKDRHTYITNLYRKFNIPVALLKQISVKGIPLIINETMWALGVAIQMQSYSLRGLEVVAGMNISSTISNLFNVVFIALGSSVAIIVGQLLGAGKLKEAKLTASRMIAFSVECCFGIALVMIAFSPYFPKLYNTTEQVRDLAKWFIIITASAMPIQAFLHSSYFTIRSGGKTLITFIFDAGYMWVFTIPLIYLVTRFTTLPIMPIYCICLYSDIVKVVIGFILVKKGVWIQNIVEDKKEIQNIENKTSVS